MGYIRQDVFSVGEVDEINFNETSSALYLKSLKKGLNFLISETGKAEKRTGFKNINSLSDIPIGAKLTPETRLFKFLAADGEYYIVFATNLAFDFYKISDNTFLTPVVTPYITSDLILLNVTNGENTLVVTHPSFVPARVNETGGVFTYDVFLFAVQPAFDFGVINYNDLTATVVISPVGSLNFTLELSGEVGFDAAWIGGVIIGGGDTADDPIGYGIISDVVVGGGITTFTALIKIRPKTGVFKGSDFSIRQPVFTIELGFPKSVIFYQNRIWFGGTDSLKNSLFGSKINQFDNFDVGVGRPSDAIVYSIGDSNASEILFLNAGKQIEIYTLNKEFVAPQPNGVALTPTTFSVRPQSSYGVSSLLQPINYENDSYFVGRGGKSLIRFEFQGLGESYASENISIASSHLINSPTRRAILQSTETSQENYLFLLNPESSLTVYQFTDISDINAFTPLTFGDSSNIDIFDIIDVDNELYMLVQLITSSKFILVRFDEDFYHDFYQVKNLPTDGIITGLTDYEGYTVSVVFEGQDFGNYLVTSGQITVVNTKMETGDSTIGLTYPADLTPLSIFGGEGLTDAFKKSSYVYVDFFKSLNFRVNGKLVPFQTFSQIQTGESLTPKTGRVRFGTGKGWQLEEDLNITQFSPLPLNILAIAYQVEGELI